MIRLVLLALGLGQTWAQPVPAPPSNPTPSRRAAPAWPVWTGMGTATTDCIGTDGGTMQCRGVAGAIAVHGAPTTTTLEAWPGKAARFNGSTDYLVVASAGVHPGSFAQCAVINHDEADAVARTIAATEKISTYRYGDAVYPQVGVKAVSGTAALAFVSEWAKVCWAYIKVGEGTSILRFASKSSRGVVTAEITDVAATVPDGTALTIGAFSDGTYLWKGQIARVTDWDGIEPSLDALTAAVQ